MFIIEVPYFSLEQIYNSYQAPLWLRSKNKWIVVDGSKAVKVEQKGERLIFDCSCEDFYNVWFPYFTLDKDYRKLNMDVSKAHKKFKKLAFEGKGIHLLNHSNAFEVYIYSRLIKNVSCETAFTYMNCIAEDCGIKHKQSMRELGMVRWNEFPNLETLEKNLHKLRPLGKVNKWLEKVVDKTKESGFSNRDFNDLEWLLSGYTTKFPLEEIKETLEKNFKLSPEKLKEAFEENCQDYAGLIYLYILYYVKKNRVL